jgi:lipoprotein-anchoring transpeptidase ErfK/SrfK
MPILPQPSQLINCNDLSSCIQATYNFLFAILLALSFLWFLYGAFQYLLSGAKIYSKDEGKNKMKNAIISLVIVLVIPVILNMINPDIFNAQIQIPKVTVIMPELKISIPETAPEDQPARDEKVYDASPDPSLSQKLKQVQYITKIVVDCSSQQAKIYGKQADGSEQEISTINIRTGKQINGQKCNPDNKPGSHTTPIGTFTLTNKRYNQNGIFSKETGASIGTRAITYDGSRGLLIHGSATEDKDAKFVNTYGCIRMKNADLAAIYDKVNSGQTKLIIQ